MSDLLEKRHRPRNLPRPVLKLGKSERTRAEILDAALRFLWNHPFRELSVARLMAGTNVGRSTFYQYFNDIHELMESLLLDLQEDIMTRAGPWFGSTGEIADLLRRSLEGLVHVGYEKGPILKAVADAAPNDERLERAWQSFLGHFDKAVADRIKADQRQGLIVALDPDVIAMAFNRLDAYALIHAFGEHPRKDSDQLLEALFRIWMSTLYECKPNTKTEPLIRRPDEATSSR